MQLDKGSVSLKSGQSDNVGDNKTPSDAEVAGAQEGIRNLDSTQIVFVYVHDLERQVATE